MKYQVEEVNRLLRKQSIKLRWDSCVKIKEKDDELSDL